MDNLLKDVQTLMKNHDPAHDFLHIDRVVKLAKAIGEKEGADMNILLPAAALHDIAEQDKSSLEQRKKLSEKSAEIAKGILSKNNSSEEIERILYAIEVHSFSKGITPKTKEAKILQDADRLDALGAIGIARLFSVCATMKTEFYNKEDPFADNRDLDDRLYAIDHIPIKLEKLEFHTETAKTLARGRKEFIIKYLEQLKKELNS